MRTGRIPKAAAKQLARVLVFNSTAGDVNHEAAPKPPAGLPSHLFVYDRWLDERGMHPRDVDRLTRDELFWLPVIHDAKSQAARTLADTEAATRN